jgi:uncharacterized protein (TIGR02147 family)
VHGRRHVSDDGTRVHETRSRPRHCARTSSLVRATKLRPARSRSITPRWTRAISCVKPDWRWVFQSDTHVGTLYRRDRARARIVRDDSSRLFMDAALKLRRCPIDVFGYLDYRQFLADLYAAKKPQGFSYRVFSRMAGLGAPNYLQLVINGKRNLTPAMAERFAKACGLRTEAGDYFCRLVEFNQSTSAKEREQCYAKLSAFARYRNAQKLELAHAAYFSTWYIPAIRELCGSPAFVCDPQWIANALIPPIKPQEASRALEVLIDLGLLARTPTGGVQQRAAVVSTGPQTRGIHLRRYHAEMMQHAVAAMEHVPAAERDVSSLTLCLSAEGLMRVKERIQEFRRQLIEFAESEVRREQAVQVNFQLFPLSVALVPRASARPSTEMAQRA